MQRVGGNSSDPKRCKRGVETETNIESLPDEVLFEILVRLSAEDIYQSARPVCTKWRGMTNTPTFIYAHLHRTPSHLLLQTRAKADGSLLVAVRNGRIEISKLRHTFDYWTWLSCNGLMIDYLTEPRRSIHIVNPVTKRRFVLPYTDVLESMLYGIAYAPTSREYKVVVTTTCLNTFTGDCCFIFTLGVDTYWRNVSSAQLSFDNKLAFSGFPLITPGFLHWYRHGNRVLTLDIETEIIRETPAPIPEVDGYRWTYLSTGSYISLLLGNKDYLWQVWEMKPKTGEWRKLTNISLEAHKCRFDRFLLMRNEIITPIGWLMYPEVLVFGFSRGSYPSIFPYNLVTKEIDAIELPKSSRWYKCLIHKSSLVRV